MSHAQDKALLQTISPIDDSVYVERALATEQEIEQSIALSRSAQKQWQTTSFAEPALAAEVPAAKPGLKHFIRREALGVVFIP